MMRANRQVVAVLALVAALTALAPTMPAAACSCAEPDLDALLEREPDAVVARIRRIDPEGGAAGVGLVEEVLHGPRLPEQLPLSLDDGGSCQPWVSVGEVAVLAFLPDGSGWETMTCGRFAPTVGLNGPVEVDQDARGDPALVVIGSFPGADLLALDDHLRVLAHGSIQGVAHGLQRCDGDLLIQSGGPEGEAILSLVSLPDLEVVAERQFGGDAADMTIADTSCGFADTVDVLTLRRGESQVAQLHADVFAADEEVVLPAAEDAAFTDEGVVLLRTSGDDGDSVALVGYDPETGGTDEILSVDGMWGYEVTVAPDGAHAVIRGFQEDPQLLVVELATERVVARSSGWWQPVQQPWVDSDHLLQRDESAGGVGETGLTSLRIVDLELTPVATLPRVPSWNATATDGSVVLAGGNGITAVDSAGEPVRSAVEPWAAGATGGVLLGPVSPGPVVTLELPPVDGNVARAARLEVTSDTLFGATSVLGPAGGPIVAGLGTVLVLGLMLTLLWLRRRRAVSSAGLAHLGDADE